MLLMTDFTSTVACRWTVGRVIDALQTPPAPRDPAALRPPRAVATAPRPGTKPIPRALRHQHDGRALIKVRKIKIISHFCAPQCGTLPSDSSDSLNTFERMLKVYLLFRTLMNNIQHRCGASVILVPPTNDTTYLRTYLLTYLTNL